VATWKEDKMHGKVVFFKGKNKGKYAEYQNGEVAKELPWETRKKFMDTLDKKLNYRRSKGAL
jgi:hypothetical protein